MSQCFGVPSQQIRDDCDAFGGRAVGQADQAAMGTLRREHQLSEVVVDRDHYSVFGDREPQQSFVARV